MNVIRDRFCAKIDGGQGKAKAGPAPAAPPPLHIFIIAGVPGGSHGAKPQIWHADHCLAFLALLLLVHAQHLDPLPIVEIPLAIRERAREQPFHLPRRQCGFCDSLSPLSPPAPSSVPRPPPATCASRPPAPSRCRRRQTTQTPPSAPPPCQTRTAARSSSSGTS